jgi:hypothetical protein
MNEKSLVDLLFVIGRQLQLLCLMNVTLTHCPFSVFFVFRRVYNHFTVSDFAIIYLIYIYFGYPLLLYAHEFVIVCLGLVAI